MSARIVFTLLVATLLLYGDPVFLKFATVWTSGFALAFLVAGGWRIAGKHAAIACFISASAILILDHSNLVQSMQDRSGASIIGSGVAFAFVIAWRTPKTRRTTFWPVRLLSPSANWSYTLYLIHFPLLMLGFSLTRPLAHPFGAEGEYFCGMVWLVITIFVASRIGPTIENRWAVRRWFERCIARNTFSLKVD
jgi:peptidoglycan/LPS O-acetylase OafA/YrhL